MIAANGFAQGVIDYEANLRALYYDLATTTWLVHTLLRSSACCSPSPRPTICSTDPTIPTSLHRCSSRVWRG